MSSPSLQIGEIHQVHIERILPFGLRVQLASGVSGLIRTRELCWEDIGKPDWKQRYPLYKEYSAKLIGWEREQPLLSLRFAQRDPWETAGVHYRLGKIHSGTVSGFSGPLAFIELEPGVIGRLHRSQLPAWHKGPIEEFLWLGDQVRVLVEQVNLARREMSLTMRGLEKLRWPTVAATDDTGSARREFAPHRADPNLALFIAQTPRSLLVVEDDEAQNQALCGWLRSAGHTVESALSESQAKAALARRSFEGILSDVGLSEGDGIRFLAEMMPHFPDSRWVLMTDWTTVESRAEEVRNLEAAGALLLLKPVLPEDIQRALGEPNSKQHLTEGGSNPDAETNLRRREELPRTGKQKEALSAQIQQILEQLRRSSRASRVLLFHLHTRQRQLALAGDTERGGLDEAALGRLLHSPVREVLDEDEIVQVTDSQAAEAYTRNLTYVLRFRSCVGVPVPARIEDRYALFLFHSEIGFASDSIAQEAANAALALAARLEQKAALAQILEVQRASLIGHLARGMIHEVNHHLGPIVWALPLAQAAGTRLEQALDRLSERPTLVLDGVANPLPDMRWDAQKLREHVGAVRVGVDNLSQTTRLFGRITVQDTEQLLRVERIVEICLDMVRDMADRAKVKLCFEPGERIHLTRARESQLQQILLNLLVNAVQQIERIRPGQGGRVTAAVTSGEEQGQQTIRIAVEDDGPGIHRRLWRHIFGLGVTTREREGSGMGLFVAERLAEDLGGSVQVEESFVDWGSCFVVELPVQA